MIETENSGPSIAQEDLPQIFERFYRGRDDTSGHGLGLAIAREAVEMSQGVIGARNTERGVAVAIALRHKADA
jgi:signal transduction histidine kinase